MPHRSTYKRILAKGIAVLGVAFGILALSAGARDAVAISSDDSAVPPPGLGAAAPAASEAAGTRIAEGLQRKLQGMTAGETVDVIVTMTPGRGPEAAQSAAGPFEVGRRFTIINGFSATMTRAQVEALAGSPAVERIEEDIEVRAFLSDAKKAFGVDRLHGVDPVLPMELGAPVTGAGTAICVIDTGIDAAHTDLSGKVQGFCDATTGGCGASDPGTTPPYDDHYHGTHVSSMAAGYMGVAPGADLYGAKVLDSGGSGSESDVIAGIEFCAAQPNVGVLNLSLGSPGCEDGSDGMSLAATAAVQDHDKVVVIAAGNFGPGRCSIGPLASAGPGPIAVGAVTEWVSPDGGWRKELAVFSSRGPTADGRIKPDIAAPGVDITAASANTGNDVRTLSGTSMASPFVAGVAALMLEVNGALLPQELKWLMGETAVRRAGDQSTLVGQGGGWPKDNDFGWGLINPYAAVAAAMAAAGYTETPFPTFIYENPTIADYTVWDYEFEVTDPDTLLSVNVFNGGPWKCTGWFFGSCLSVDAGADFDAELYTPTNAMVDESTCEVDSDTQCGAVGRQETLLAEPADFPGGQLPLGTWRVRVYPWNSSPSGTGPGDGNDSEPSEIAHVLITMGPVGDGAVPANDPPVAADDSMTVAEGGAQTQLDGGATSVRANDSDAEDALADLAVSLETGPANGNLTLNTDGTFIYTHDGGESTADSFIYRLTDLDGASDTATVSIAVTPVNDPPVFASDPIDGGSAEAGSPYNWTLAGTAGDPEGDSLSFSKISGAAWLSVAADGTLGGTPGDADTGLNQFTVEVNDGNGGTDQATLEVTVNSVNDPPVANDDSVTTAEDTAVAVTLTATDPEGDPLTYAVVTGPSNGVLSGTAPTLTYTPNSNYSGPDSFTFKANDGTADSNTATVSITVNPVNDPPVANDDSVTTDEDTAVAVTLTASDPEGDPLSYAVVTGPSNGVLSGTAPNLTYTPNGGYSGPDSFTFNANDGVVDSNTATVSVTVNSVNDPPVANDDNVATDEDTAVALTLTATDPEGDPLTYSVVTGPSNGALSGTAPTLTYTPGPNYSGPDSFTFKANDGTSDGNTATVSISVNPVNDPPVANDDSVTTDEDTAVAIALTASDPEGDPLTYGVVTGPSNGALSGTAPNLTYTPNAGYFGPDSFTFKANDGLADSNIATVSITVNEIAPPPLVADFSWSTSTPVVGESVTVTALAQSGASYAWSIVWPGGWKNDPGLSPLEGPSSSFTPQKTGDHTVTLTVSRAGEPDAVTSKTIAVGDGGDGGSGNGKPCNPNKPGCTGG